MYHAVCVGFQYMYYHELFHITLQQVIYNDTTLEGLKCNRRVLMVRIVTQNSFPTYRYLDNLNMMHITIGLLMWFHSYAKK